jgi:hypothetical protein
MSQSLHQIIVAALVNQRLAIESTATIDGAVRVEREFLVHEILDYSFNGDFVWVSGRFDPDTNEDIYSHIQINANQPIPYFEGPNIILVPVKQESLYHGTEYAAGVAARAREVMKSGRR